MNPSRSRSLGLFLMVACAILISAGFGAAQPDFTGVWQRDESVSSNARREIDRLLGPRELKGAGGQEYPFRLSPGTSELDRLDLRRDLLKLAHAFERISIEQTGTEVSLYDGYDELRIFYIDEKEHLRQTREGVKVECECGWRENELVIDQETERGADVVETYRFVPGAGNDRLEVLVEIRSRFMNEPLLLRQIYGRVDGRESTSR